MRIVSEEPFDPIMETWDDPGVYPSAAGGGPLQSYDYIAGYDGGIVLEMDDKELDIAHANPEEFWKTFWKLYTQEFSWLPDGYQEFNWVLQRNADCGIVCESAQLDIDSLDQSGALICQSRP